MFLLIGFHTRSRKLGQESRFCSNCGRATIHSAMEIRKWFDVFFIPVSPFGREYLRRCNLCGMEWQPAKGEAGTITVAQWKRAE